MGWRSHLGSSLKEGVRPIVDLVYPPRCPLCGDAITDQGGLCADCWSELELPGEPSCSKCGLPTRGSVDAGDEDCFACTTAAPRHSGIYAASLYNDASRKLILRYKHGGKISLAPLLGRLMAARLPTPESGSEPLLVPVPLHRWRIWQRGFNQAALLARELDSAGKGELLVDGLVRHRRTPSLGGLGKAARHKALNGAIRVNGSRAARIVDRDVVLVDDVLTSGATSETCVNALLDAGANTVRIACFARVVEG